MKKVLASVGIVAALLFGFSACAGSDSGKQKCIVNCEKKPSKKKDVEVKVDDSPGTCYLLCKVKDKK